MALEAVREQPQKGRETREREVGGKGEGAPPVQSGVDSYGENISGNRTNRTNHHPLPQSSVAIEHAGPQGRDARRDISNESVKVALGVYGERGGEIESVYP